MKKFTLLVILLGLLTNYSSAIQYVPTGQVTNQSVVPGRTATDAFNYLYRYYIPAGGTNNQVWVSSGVTNQYGAIIGNWTDLTAAIDTNSIVFRYNDFTIFTNLSGDVDQVFISDGDGTGHWGDMQSGDLIYFPEQRLWPGINELVPSASIKSQGNAMVYNWGPSGVAWQPTLQKLFVISDQGDGDAGGRGVGQLLIMDQDGGNKVYKSFNMPLNVSGGGTRRDAEAICLVDYADTNYVYIGFERLGNSTTGHSMIGRIGYNNANNAATNTFWDCSIVFTNYATHNNQQLEALTFIPSNDVPRWITNSFRCTNGLFLAADQYNGKFFFLDVPLTNTASSTPYILAATNVIATWLPHLSSAGQPNDISDIFWDRTYKVLYIVLDQDASQGNDPAIQDASIKHVFYAYSLEGDRIVNTWELPQSPSLSNPYSDVEGFVVGHDRNTIYIANDSNGSGIDCVRRFDLQVRGEHDLRQRNVTMFYDPGITDDTLLGYGIGSRWDNPTDKKLWICVDNSAGAAIWKLLASTANGSANQVFISGGGQTGDWNYVSAPIVIYTNNSYVTLTNIQSALDYLLYSAPTVNLTVPSGNVTSDQGTIITNPVLTWTCDKTVTTRTLTSTAGLSTNFGAGAGGSFTNTGTFSTQRSYTISVNDGRTTSTSTRTYYFQWRKYYGLSNTASNLSNSEISLLSNSPLSTSYITSEATYIPAGDQYLWFCYPTSWAGTPKFYIATFDVTGSMISETVTFTNSLGSTTNYKLYRSPEKYTEPTLFEIR